MSSFLDENLKFGHDVFIPIEDAFEYLVDESVVYQLDQLFYPYKGFADEYWTDPTYLDPTPTLLRRVYLDALGILEDKALRNFRQMFHDAGELTIRWFSPYKGTINGKEDFPDDFNSYDLGFRLNINNCNVYVRQSDLDDASKEFGIPKNPNWNSSVLKKNIGKEEKDYIGDSVNVNAATSISDSQEESVIEFTKSVLIQHPDAKTADLKRNCFEDMNKLNARDSKIINEILIKAGAKKAKRGEHAKDIGWETKYPKAQWMRVFNKIK